MCFFNYLFPMLSHNFTQAPVAVRLGVLLEVLGTKESALAPLPLHLRLAVAVTAFWLRQATPTPSQQQLQALVLGMVYDELSWNNRPGATHYPHAGQLCLSYCSTRLQTLTCISIKRQTSLMILKPVAAVFVILVPQLNWAAEHNVLTGLDRQRVRPGERRGLDVGVAHGFSQWQACLWSALCLNQLLLLPLPEPHLSW